MQLKRSILTIFIRHFHSFGVNLTCHTSLPTRRNNQCANIGVTDSESHFGITQSEMKKKVVFLLCTYMVPTTTLLGLLGDFKAPESTIFDLKKPRKCNKATVRVVEPKGQACNIKGTAHLSPVHNSLREQTASSHFSISHPFIC